MNKSRLEQMESRLEKLQEKHLDLKNKCFDLEDAGVEGIVDHATWSKHEILKRNLSEKIEDLEMSISKCELDIQQEITRIDEFVKEWTENKP